MSPARERLILGLLVALLPFGLFWTLIRPSVRRMEALHQRIEATHETFPFQSFTPVGQKERALLEAPEAPWRSRIPTVADDGTRLAHVNRVVNELTTVLTTRGVRLAGMRAALDPITADFTLPASLAMGPAPRETGADAPELRMTGWVLEVEIAGAAGDLFKALAAVAGTSALVEPVGLRWEVPAAPAEPKPRQYLMLRNYYLQP